MNSVRYVGLDVHQDTISAAVLDEGGRLIQQSILATRAAAILEFIGGCAALCTCYKIVKRRQAEACAI
jgi:Fe-S cluster biogenesis protein NfuA